MDSYLLRGINVVAGSVVIDRRLAVYRLHGMNEFSKHPDLNGVLSYDRNSPSDNNELGRRMIIDHLIANARLFLAKIPSPWHYMAALQVLNDFCPRLPSTVPGCGSYLEGRVVTEAATLAPAFGFFEFIVLLKRLKAAPYVILRAMNALKAVDDPSPRLPSPVAGCRSYLAGKLVAEAATLAPALGFFKFIVLLARLKVAPHVILKAWLNRTKQS